MRLSAVALTLTLALSALPMANPADAARTDGRSEARQGQTSRSTPQASRGFSRSSVRHGTSSGWGGISCVPYARSITGMDIAGNGRDWWHNAAGRYARGQRPQAGSVLAFPGSGGMSSGHVAVVSRVVHSRMIEIDHANWGGPGIRRGTVMRNVRVMDVSDDNSWTRVRVQVGWDNDTFGREYPTYGFIHNRPASTFAAVEDEMIRPVSFVRSRQVVRDTARPAAQRTAQPPSRAQARRPQPQRQVQLAAYRR
ncbi:MAG: CHAP domain-containing protein [Acetobacteraceae bacterium]|nr:CHAP domain-containing protein [Acetobacteraceae bacterium]